jgi:hypothetical protein
MRANSMAKFHTEHMELSKIIAQKVRIPTWGRTEIQDYLINY